MSCDNISEACDPKELESKYISNRITCIDTCNTNYCKNLQRKIIESKIQNQVAVDQNQMLSVLSAMTIRGSKNNFFNMGDRKYSRFWGNKYNLRNQSDRKNPHKTLNNNVPSGGNSTKSSITALRPGSLAPGGSGVDVKHGSYARYLGKLKANNITHNNMGPFPDKDINKSVVNNKSYRFSIIKTPVCCQ